MKKLTAILSIASTLSASTAALAGGVIPQGMGSYDDGRTINMVPSSSSMVRWRSYGSLNAEDRDIIMEAVASVDYETQEFSLLWADPGEADAGQTQLFFSGKNDALWPECQDEIPGNCPLANTTCLVKVRSGNYELCSEYRTSLYMANIEYRAAAKGIPFAESFRAIVRHEIGHVLGFKHFDPGPMTNDGNAPFSDCQLAMWEVFNIDPNITTWSYPAKPSVCQ